MQGGRKIVDAVVEPLATVKVNGAVRDTERVSVTRELPTDLPESVVGTGGFTAATGHVTFAPRIPVISSADSPWSRAALLPPLPGDGVSVDIGFNDERFGDQEWRQLTGTFDEASGEIAAASVEASLVDFTDRLRTPVTQPAILAYMPTVSRFLPEKVQACGLTAVSVVDRLMRRAGFSATPAPLDSSYFGLPLTGDLHPDFGGELLSSATPTTPPSWSEAPWGPAVRRPSVVTWALTDPRLGPRMPGFEFSVQTVPNTSDFATIWIGFSGRRLIQLRLTGSATTLVLTKQDETTLSHSVAKNTAQRVSGRVRLLNDGARMKIDLWLGDVQVVADLSWTPPAIPDNTSPVWFVGMDGTLPLGGFVLDQLWPTERPRLVDVAPNMRFTVDRLGDLDAFPAIMGREVLDLVREASSALCSALWLDEYGTAQWVSRGKLLQRPPVTTVKSATDVHDVGWKVSSAGLRHRVSVTRRLPAITVQAAYGVPLFQASEIISTDVETSLFIHPAGDVDWIAVDTELKFPSGTPPISEFDLTRGIGSWAATRLVDDTSVVPGIEEPPNTGHLSGSGYGQVIYDLVQLDPQTLLFTAQNAVAGSRVSWSTDENFPIEELRHQYTPYIRGRAMVQWTETTTKSPRRGPSLAADLEHVVGPWIQRESEAQELADWLAAYCQTPVARIESLNIFPDLRLQLGDMVDLDFDDALHYKIRALVVGIAVDATPTQVSQNLTLRLVTAAPKPALLGDHDDAWRGADLGEQDRFWDLATLGDLDLDPTRSS